VLVSDPLDQPSAVSHRSSAISHQPSAVSRQPSFISHQPSAISHPVSGWPRSGKTVMEFSPLTVV
jgi:hypothetical protein